MVKEVVNVWDSVSEDSLPQVAEQIFTQFPNMKVFLFEGNLGAGKTSLIKAMCQVLQVEDSVSSPSFPIINEYHSKTNSNIYHFDLYRLESLEEVFDIGFEEYLMSGSYCFIEWPQIAEELLPDNYALISIENIEEQVRRVTCIRYGSY